MNIHMVDANPAKVTSMHFYGWKQGLKTGMYYLRTKAAADAIQFTVEAKKGEDQTVLPDVRQLKRLNGSVDIARFGVLRGWRRLRPCGHIRCTSCCADGIHSGGNLTLQWALNIDHSGGPWP